MDQTSQHDDMTEFLAEEREEISKYKWIRSEEAGRDLGVYACIEWIQKYAVSFREYWNNKTR